MYGFDYELEPASEGIGSFFSMVLDKIKEAGEKIKDWLDKVALRIKRMTGRTSEDQVKQDSEDALKDIDEIEASIVSILDACSKQIDVLYAAYLAVSKETDPKKQEEAFKKKGGMDTFSSAAKNDSKAMEIWGQVKQDVGEYLAKQKGEAEKVSDKLKGLSKYGPLGLSATKTGYNGLRKIFSANGTFGARWKKVKIAAEWSTGTIKESLNKVVSIYDVGIRATDAFGRRLSSGNVRSDDGSRMEKEDLKSLKSEYKSKNKIYKENKRNRTIETDRKDKNFTATQFSNVDSGAIAGAMRYYAGKVAPANSSVGYVLDRLYQMAYEDAMNDMESAQTALEAYEGTPGAYEFVDDYDPDFDVEYDPLYM